MEETYVRLLCPECGKQWEEAPSELPATSTAYDCGGCQSSHRLSEFARTEHDLRTIKRLG